MTLKGEARRLTIYVGEDDQWQHKPLYTEIVHRAHLFGLAGASVFRGLEGYGASSRIHSARILSLSEDLPLAVVIVDREERIREFLSSRLDELQIDGLIVLEDVEVIRYAGAIGLRDDLAACRPGGDGWRAVAVSDRPIHSGPTRHDLTVGHPHG